MLHEPHVSVRGHHLGAEVAEALREPLRPQPRAGEAVRGMVQENPRGADELGDAVQPVLVEVVDQAITQDLACHEQRSLRVHGCTPSVRR